MQQSDPLEFVIDSALQDLYRKTGFRTLMVTRTMDDDWVAYRSLDQSGKVKDGHVFCWSDSICSRRMRGEGPEIAPDVEQVPAYKDAPIRKQYPTRAYFGIPMLHNDGTLIGMLCGMDGDAHSDELLATKSTLDHHAKTITALLKARLHIVEKQRASSLKLPNHMTDQLTGLGNRRGWDEVLRAEEERHISTGGVGAIISIGMEPDKADNQVESDYAVVKCARAISSVMRAGDFAARFGGDEFGLLLPESSSDRSRRVFSDLRDALASADAGAYVALALRRSQDTFEKAALIADSRMSEERHRTHCRKAA